MSSRTRSGNGFPQRARAGDRRAAQEIRRTERPRSAGLRSLVAMGLVALTLSAPALALGAPTVPALKILLWTTTTSSDKRLAVFVSGELPASTPLPATIVIPVPPDVEPEWVGEIVGTDPSKDPTAAYTITQAAGYGVMTITVKSARIAQAEFLVSAPASGADIVLSASVPILGPVEDVTLSLEPPSGSSVTTASPGLIKTPSGGGDNYVVIRKSPAVGTVLAGSLTARSGSSTGTAGQSGQTATDASGSTPSSGGNTAATLVATLLTAAAGFGLYAAWANREKLTALVRGPAAEDKATEEDRPVVAPKRRRDRSPVASAPRPEPEAEADPEPEAETEAEPEAEAEEHSPVRAGGVDPPAPQGHDLVVLVKEVSALRTEGLLDPDEFASAKARLLDGDAGVVARLRDTALLRTSGVVDDAEFAMSKQRALDGDAGFTAELGELAGLNASGVLAADEYAEAKRSLLRGDARVVTLLREVAGFSASGFLTPDEFSAVKEHLLTGSSEIVAEIEDLAALDTEGLLTREEFRIVVDRLLGE